MNMPDAGLALCILFTALMLYDLWLVKFKGTGSSVSNFLIRSGFKSPVIVGGIMFLAGHLFGGMYLNADPKWYTPGYNIAFSIYLLAFGLIVFAGARVCLKVGENKALSEAREVIELQYEETKSYIELNHLGDVHNNLGMRNAREWLDRWNDV